MDANTLLLRRHLGEGRSASRNDLVDLLRREQGLPVDHAYRAVQWLLEEGHLDLDRVTGRLRLMLSPAQGGQGRFG